MKSIVSVIKRVEATLFLPMCFILIAGLVTMSSFQGNDSYFWKQGLFIILAIGVFSVASLFEYRFLKQTRVVVGMYTFLLGILSLLFILGKV